MNKPLVVTMDALWPDMPEQRRRYEVVVTVPREDGGEPLVPRALPAVVLGCWSATLVTASVTVMAARPSRRPRRWCRNWHRPWARSSPLRPLPPDGRIDGLRHDGGLSAQPRGAGRGAG